MSGAWRNAFHIVSIQEVSYYYETKSMFIKISDSHQGK